MITKNENRETIMKLLKEENRTPKSVSEEYNIPLQTIYTWIRKERIELSRLEREDDSNFSMSVPEMRKERIKNLENEVSQLKEKIRLLEDSLRNLNDYLIMLKEKYEK